MSKCSLAWLLRYLSIVGFFWGVNFLLAYLMFAVCKAISFYMKKASYNWKFIAEKTQLTSQETELFMMCEYYVHICILPGEGTCPSHSAPNNFIFPSVSHRGHICPTPPCVVCQGQKALNAQKERHKTRCRTYRDLTT